MVRGDPTPSGRAQKTWDAPRGRKTLDIDAMQRHIRRETK
jgi:hypothetical protein